MSAKHTPGPWKAEWHSGGHEIVGNGGFLADVPITSNRPVSETAANGRLIAAAPELLAALQAIVEEADGPSKPYSGDSYLPPHLIQAARVAIANATRPGSWGDA